MLTTPVRFLIVLALLIPAVYGFQHGKTGLAFGLLAVAAVQVFAYLRYGSVLAAGKAFRRNDRERAWSLLAQTPFRGTLLHRSHRAYYHLLRSSCLLDREDWDAVRREASAVLAIQRVPPENHSAAHAGLARAALGSGDLAAAAEHVAAARALPCKSSLTPLLRDVEDEIAERAGDD